MKTRVKFIEAQYLDELEKKVNELLSEGWKIQSNLALANDAFYMALIRES